MQVRDVIILHLEESVHLPTRSMLAASRTPVQRALFITANVLVVITVGIIAWSASALVYDTQNTGPLGSDLQHLFTPRYFSASFAHFLDYGGPYIMLNAAVSAYTTATALICTWLAFPNLTMSIWNTPNSEREAATAAFGEELNSYVKGLLVGIAATYATLFINLWVVIHTA